MPTPTVIGARFWPGCLGYGHGKYDRYLHAYTEIDLILDTEPFSGATTTCEALWMGVPTVTRHGLLTGGRQGVSLLQALDENFWIASSTEDAISITRQAQNNPQRLRNFKSGIRDKILRSRLGDGKKFAAGFHQTLSQLTPLRAKA